jgi:DNA-binding transcriptional regulator GbsR (MarR family)
MTLDEGKQKFIEAFGNMASDWGINRTMAQVHALLMISDESLTAQEVQSKLGISTGNTSMNLRALLDWGLIHKEQKSGDRKEYFSAEKDIAVVVRQIIINRKKRELEPMLKVLDELAEVQELCPKSEAFCKVVHDIRALSHKANTTLEFLSKADPALFAGLFGSDFAMNPKI